MKPDGAKNPLVESFAHALAGIVNTATGRNFRIQLCFGVAAVVLGLVLGISAPEWLAVVVCIGLVLGGECLNTAIEASIDLAGSNFHPLAKRAKDAAAGGVLVFSFASLVVGLAVFLPRIVALVF